MRDKLINTTVAKLNEVVGNKTILFIDETHHIPNLRPTLKLFADQMKSV